MDALYAISGFILMLAMISLAVFFKTVSAEHVAFKLRLEKIVDKLYSGCWCFVFWPIERLFKYPKQQQHIDLKPQTIISEGRKIKGVEYSQAPVDTDPVFYFRWPTRKEEFEDLKESYQKAPNPEDKEALEDFLGDFVTAIIRSSLGDISWFETRQGKVILDNDEEMPLSDFICESLLKGGDGNPVVQARLKDLRVELKKIQLPKKLEDAIPLPQIAAYEATATREKADAERYTRSQEGKGDAEARKAIYKVINEAGPQGITMETLRTLEQMAQGTSNTILYGLPPQVANILKDTGYNPSQEEMGRFASMLINELRKKGMT